MVFCIAESESIRSRTSLPWSHYVGFL